MWITERLGAYFNPRIAAKVRQPLVATFDVSMYHGVYNVIFGALGISVNKRHRVFDFFYLLPSIRSKSDGSSMPVYCGEYSGGVRGYKSRRVSLIKVNAIAFIRNLFELLNSVGVSKNIVVHKCYVRTPAEQCNFVNIHIGFNVALFFGNNTPRTFVGASTRNKSISLFLSDLWKYRIVGLQSVDLIGEMRVDVISRAAFDDITVERVWVIRCKIKITVR